MASIDFSTVPSGVSLSEDRTNELSSRATETATAFQRKIEKLQATFAEARDRYSREADKIVASAIPEARAGAQQFSKVQLANQIDELRRNLVASSEGERAAMLKALKGYADEAAAISDVTKSPVMMLGRIALGDPKRTAYIQQLAGAGPVELETAARQAIMSNDLVLAAAIATVVDRAPRDQRKSLGWTPADLARRVMGSLFENLKANLDGIQLAFKTAMAANREFERGKADPLVNLSLALSRRAASEAAARG